MNEVGSLKEFIEFIVKHLVNHPEDVQVGEVEGEHFVVYELRVAKRDIGLVIGKRGQRADAIRHLLNAAAVSARKGKRVTLEILE